MSRTYSPTRERLIDATAAAWCMYGGMHKLASFVESCRPTPGLVHSAVGSPGEYVAEHY